MTQTFYSSTWEAGLDRGIVSSRLVGTHNSHTYACAHTQLCVCGGRERHIILSLLKKIFPLNFLETNWLVAIFSKDLSVALIF